MFKRLSRSVTGDVVSCELSHAIDLMRSDTFTKSSQKQVFPLSSHLGDTTWQLFGLLNWGRGLKAGFSGQMLIPQSAENMLQFTAEVVSVGTITLQGHFTHTLHCVSSFSFPTCHMDPDSFTRFSNETFHR